MRIIAFRTSKYSSSAESRTRYFENLYDAIKLFEVWRDDEENDEVVLWLLELVDDITYLELAVRCLDGTRYAKNQILLDKKDRKAEQAIKELGDA